jgi:RimJ/RimL family protein N-acetyltransferase
MDYELNHLGQPVGRLVANWAPPDPPSRESMDGAYCRVEPLSPEAHGASLYKANSADTQGRNWTYLSYGPFPSFEAYYDWVSRSSSSTDPLFFAIVDKATHHALGVAGFVRIDPRSGSIEVGHLNFSPRLQGTQSATEAMYLMMKKAFDLGYRRYEWKANALNAPSRRAAQRLGLSFEGVFRQAAVFKGRNRDTACYAVMDRDWPALQRTFLQWLNPVNFDEKGRQKVSLSALTTPILRQRG